MSENNELFSPQNVDESIEEILISSQHHLPGQQPKNADVRLMQGLQRLYDPESARYQQVLQRVEERLLAQRLGNVRERTPLRSLPVAPEQLLLQAQQKNRKSVMDDKKTGWRRVERTLGLLVAIFVLVIAVGGFIIAQGHFSLTGTAGKPPATPSPTSQIVQSPTPQTTNPKGITIPGDQMGFQSVAWSNDSQRIAASTDSGVRIWMAATGKKILDIKLPGENEWAYGLSWSPDSRFLAIGTNQALHIVDSQTGKVVNSYTPSLAQTTTPGAMSSLVNDSHYATLLPTSGGLGFRAVAWSPDGNSIAVNISAGYNGYIQVLKAQNATLDYTLTWDGDYNGIGLAWSSDSQYLATSVFNTQGGGDPATANFVYAWELASKTLVFKENGGANPVALAFQPKTHNLAFNAYAMAKPASIQVWNVETQKKLANYTGANLVSWSPDGKQLAYNGFTQLGKNNYTSNITFIDATTGKIAHTHSLGKAQVNQLFWSPNGKYMLTIEANSSMSNPSADAHIWPVA
ncbi:WD40 repeat domain-containing protein [Ktedonospora formicarum]|uniref:Anaphase-promoting complex subunit 4-like WD40 domain-containing protein n=1 Tax=Ktedonospora formicarum TaxID=2778364 RepID=A0A8J3I7E5_9CHLR|nr:hypothetical protein [Ktedonospora formicarum]GHO50924.1 hypothetical protein KSX_90870 [Ktedonospora formicarum]